MCVFESNLAVGSVACKRRSWPELFITMTGHVLHILNRKRYSHLFSYANTIPRSNNTTVTDNASLHRSTTPSAFNRDVYSGGCDNKQDFHIVRPDSNQEVRLFQIIEQFDGSYTS